MKKVLSLVLSMLMVLSVLPITPLSAYAEEDRGEFVYTRGGYNEMPAEPWENEDEDKHTYTFIMSTHSFTISMVGTDRMGRPDYTPSDCWDQGGSSLTFLTSDNLGEGYNKQNATSHTIDKLQYDFMAGHADHCYDFTSDEFLYGGNFQIAYRGKYYAIMFPNKRTIEYKDTSYDGTMKIYINHVKVYEKGTYLTAKDGVFVSKNFEFTLPDSAMFRPETIEYKVKGGDDTDFREDNTIYQNTETDPDSGIVGRVYLSGKDQYGVNWKDWNGSLVSTTHPDTDTATFVGTEGKYGVWEVKSTLREDHDSHWKLNLTNGNGEKVYYDKDFDLDLSFAASTDIHYSEAVNGKVSGKQSQISGRETTVIVTPDDGYELDTLTVTDENGNNLPVSDDYKFTMPDCEVTVSATFKECPHYYGDYDHVSYFNYDGVPIVATFYIPCTNPYCSHVETIYGTITEEDGKDAVYYVATAKLRGKTYTERRAGKAKDLSQITVDSVENGEATADHSTAYTGETVTLSATADEGYRFRKYTVKDAQGNEIAVNDGKFTMPSSNVTVTPEFGKLYTITYLSLQNGSVSGVTSAISGDKVRVNAVPNDGYAVDTISIQNAQGETYTLDYDTFEMPENNVFVLANFTKGTAIQYISENGEIIGKRYAHEGDEVSMTASPDEGYRLVSLTAVDENGNDIAITDNQFIMPAVPVTVTAEFEVIPKRTVQWYAHGRLMETDEGVDEGTLPEYNGETPGDYIDENGVEYTFAGWSPEIAPITGDTTYQAVYTEKGRYLTTYLDENGEEQIVLAIGVTEDTAQLTDGWYVVRDNITNNNRIKVSGDAHLILSDGVKLTAPKGIGVDNESAFSLYEQTNHTGELLINGVGDYNAAIGGGVYSSVTVTINGGNISATGGESAAAIGCGMSGVTTKIVINGGTIDVTGGNQSAGIGSGYLSGDTDITINGGDVKAMAGSGSAGIGGGLQSTANVKITGGIVNVGGACGIGGGYQSNAADSNITLTYTDYAKITSGVYTGIVTLENKFTDGNEVVFYEGVVEDNSTIAGYWLVPYYPSTITYKGIDGTVSGVETAYYGDEVTLNLTPDKYHIPLTIDVRDARGNSVPVSDNKFTMPATDVTVTARFEKLDYKEATEPYVDENGEYIPGNIAYCYNRNGRKYAVSEDGTVGEWIGDVEVLYYEFELLEDDTYRINYYTGPTENLTEMVIPKTYNGKKVTVVGSNTNQNIYKDENPTKTQFTLVLNENITRIEKYTFYVVFVTEVKGDTSNLNHIGEYAFSWANSPDDYKITLNLDYPNEIIVGANVFNNMHVTARITHTTTFSKSRFAQQSISYEYTDAHPYGEPVWTWADDYSSASVSLTCTDSRCRHEDILAADVTYEDVDEKRIYTATAEIWGTTYTDTKETAVPLDTDAYNAALAEANALLETGLEQYEAEDAEMFRTELAAAQEDFAAARTQVKVDAATARIITAIENLKKGYIEPEYKGTCNIVGLNGVLIQTNGEEEYEAQYNEKVYLINPSVSGKLAYTDANGDAIYAYLVGNVLYAPKNNTVYIRVVGDAEEGMAYIAGTSFENRKAKYNCQYSLPDGAEFVETGIVMSFDKATALEIGADGARVFKANKIGAQNEYSITFNISDPNMGKTIYGKCYFTYIDKNGNKKTVYSEQHNIKLKED